MVLYKRTNTPRSHGHIAPGTVLPRQVWSMLRYLSVHFIFLIQKLRSRCCMWATARMPPTLCNGPCNRNGKTHQKEHQTLQTSLYLWRCTFTAEAFLIFWTWMMEVQREKLLRSSMVLLLPDACCSLCGLPYVWEEEPTALTLSSNLP